MNVKYYLGLVSFLSFGSEELSDINSRHGVSFCVCDIHLIIPVLVFVCVCVCDIHLIIRLFIVEGGVGGERG